MIHLNDISWAQVVLIQVGLIFQAIALHSLLRGSSGFHRQRHNDDHAEGHPDAEHLDHTESEEQQMRAEGHHDHAPNPNQATNMMRTSRVKFVQSFKFREQSAHTHHRIEH